MAAKQRQSVPDTTDAESQRLNVRIDPDAYRRLMIHCVMSGQQPGKYIESLINSHCREWRVQAIRSAQATSDDRLDLTPGVSLGNSLANL
jgi:hypothetical protein